MKSTLQRKPNNRELASPCQLICKIIHVSRERLVPYYRDFSVWSAHTLKYAPERILMYEMAGDCYLTTRTLLYMSIISRVRVVQIFIYKT